MTGTVIEPHEKRELFQLLGSLCNEAMSEQEHARLCQLLEKGPEYRRAYFRYLEIHHCLLQRADAGNHAEPLRVLKHELERVVPDNRPGRRANAWRYLGGVAAMVTFAVAAVYWWPTLRPTGPGKKPSSTGALVTGPSADGTLPVRGKRAVNIRTLACSADCAWERGYGPRFDGQQLLAGDLRLKTGIAELTFETSVRLVMQGPAAVSIESNDTATLHIGRVVLHGDELADEFVLHTPQGTLIDIGTEYGAFVAPGGVTEVHVFKGQVRVEPKEAGRIQTGAELLTGGDARRLDGRQWSPLPLALTGFARSIPASATPRIRSVGDVLAYEGFNYPGPELGNAEGGYGWDEPWRKDPWHDSPPTVTIVPNKSLKSAATDDGDAHGHIKLPGLTTAWRKLSTPVRVDLDAVYYISFLMRKVDEAPSGVTQYGSVSLRPAGAGRKEKILLGMSSERYPILTHCEQQLRTAPPLAVGESYFFVAKILASELASDQVMMRVYGPDERLEAVEPEVWSCVAHPIYDDTCYEWLFVYVGGDATYLIDEIRIGSTWSSITERLPGLASP